MEKIKSFYYSNQKIFNILKWVLPYLFPLLCFINLAVFLSDCSGKMLDSDMSSELVLGKLLADKGGLLSTDWYYSTEVRVLNTQIVYKTLFEFTDNWHLVRYLGSLINSLIFVLSSAYMLYHAGLKKYIPYVMAVLLMPFSNEYFKMMLYASYYVPHVAISFVFLGMLFALLRSNTKKGIISYSILMGVLSFVSCLGGLRQLCILFVPLFGASVIVLLLKLKKLQDLERKELIHNNYVKFFIISLSATILGAGGYLVNQTLFRSIFSFHYFGGIKFNEEFSYEGLIRVITGFTDLMGSDAFTGSKWDTFIAIASLALLIFVVCAMISLTARHNIIKDSELIITLYSMIGFLVMVTIYTTTNFEYTRRYLIPNFIFFIPLITIYIKYICPKKLNGKILFTKLVRIFVVLILFFILTVNSFSVIKIYDNYRPTRKLGEAAEIIMMHDCYEGYATFWNANVMTELTNGKIEVRTWYSNEPVKELDRYHNWLHVKDFGEDEHEGKIFLLFTRQEYNETTLKEKLNYDGLVLNTDQHVLFIYDSMEDIFVQ